MIVTAVVTAEMQGLSARSREEKTVYVPVRAELDVREMALEDLPHVYSVNAPRYGSVTCGDTDATVRRHRSNHQAWTLDDTRLFGSCVQLGEGNEIPDADRALGLPHAGRKRVERLPMKTILHDGRETARAGATRAAAGTAVVRDQGLLVPTAECYFKAVHYTNGGLYSIELVTGEPDGTDACANGYRLDRFEELLEYCAGIGAAPEVIGVMRRAFDIKIGRPQALKFDPAEARLRWAIDTVLGDCRKVLHRLPAATIAEWVAMRDAYEKPRQGRIPELAAMIPMARDMMRTNGRDGTMRGHERALVIETFALYDHLLEKGAPVEMPELDDVDLGSFAP